MANTALSSSHAPLPSAGAPDQNADNLLKALVLAAHLGYHASVTLMVGGTLVTGTIIEGGRYLDHLLDAVALPTDGSAEEVRTALGNFRDAYLQGQVFEAGRLGFIHLEGAKFFLPGAPQPQVADGEGVLWRGRLEQVTGFSVVAC
ncbi:MAG: hypothetical protein ACREPD_07430 [Stenotrophomonas sp.]|uniref:hypothetical protein n=1 Tax=Stenotrophomonas sp. TaxID=69392 RepID=UPI003D6D853A